MRLKYLIAFNLLLIASIAFGQATTVYTCHNDAIAATYYAEASPSQIQAWNSQTQSQYGYLGITIIGDASAQYNCHAYAWHLREGNTNRVWINNASFQSGGCYNQTHNIDPYWTGGCFVQVCNESEADKAHYYCGDHSAVASTSNPGLWESKWGSLSVVRHTRTGVPYAQPSTSVNFYASTKITGSSYVCPSGGSGTFRVKNISGATYTWTYSSNLTAVGATNGYQITLQSNVSSRAAAWVQVQVSTPCSSTPSTNRLDFLIGAPYAPITYNPSGSCNGSWQTWSLSASSSYGTNWHWYADVNPSNFNIYSPYSSSTYVSVTGGGGVRVSYNDLCGQPTLDGVTIWSNCHSFRVGPNPAGSEVTVSAESPANAKATTTTFSEVNIYDQEGNLKKHFVFSKVRSATLNLNGLPLGVYVIEIVDGKQKERQKLQIIK